MTPTTKILNDNGIYVNSLCKPGWNDPIKNGRSYKWHDVNITRKAHQVLTAAGYNCKFVLTPRLFERGERLRVHVYDN